MIPGPNLLLKTPLTNTLVKIATINSGNTFGARRWTDAKREAPMLPDQPWLRRVPGGEELFWTDACEQAGEEEVWTRPKRGEKEVPFAEAPTAEDYRRAIVTGGVATTPEQERYLRLRLWWLLNDPVRQGAPAAVSTPADREILLGLRALLDRSDANDRLLAAETSRELGDFVTAATLLEEAFPAGMTPTADFIRELTARRDSTVREIV